MAAPGSTGNDVSSKHRQIVRAHVRTAPLNDGLSFDVTGTANLWPPDDYALLLLLRLNM